MNQLLKQMLLVCVCLFALTGQVKAIADSLSDEYSAAQTGQTFRDCQDCPEMVVIPAGSFDMGSNSDDSDEAPLHRVTISYAFAVGKYEVTIEQWDAMMGNTDNLYFKKSCGTNCPATGVSWIKAQEFIQKLNAKTGKQYRLPSESEWEYACRASGQHEYCGSDNMGSVAWHDGNSGKDVHPVGEKQANAFGLYDMSGNIFEWVEDSYHDSYAGAPTDGSVWQGDGARRVFRGGSWKSVAKIVRATNRGNDEPNYKYNNIGFRLARMLPLPLNPPTNISTSDPTTECIAEIKSKKELQILKGKIELDGSANYSFEKLANKSIPTNKEKKAISLWVSEHKRCRQLGYEWRSNKYPPMLIATVDKLYTDMIFLAADLYAKKISYGDFAKGVVKADQEFNVNIAAAIQQLRQQQQAEQQQREALAQQQQYQQQQMQQQQDEKQQRDALAKQQQDLQIIQILQQQHIQAQQAWQQQQQQQQYRPPAYSAPRATQSTCGWQGNQWVCNTQPTGIDWSKVNTNFPEELGRTLQNR